MAVSVVANIDIPELIVEVQNRPALYDTSIPEYRDRLLKKRLWQEVCCKLYSEAVWNGLSNEEQLKIGKEILNKWNSLRGCFRRDLHVLKNSPSSNATKKKRKYIYFDSLLFLLPFTDVTNDESSTENDNDDQNLEKTNGTEEPLAKKARSEHKEKDVKEDLPTKSREGQLLIKKKYGDQLLSKKKEGEQQLSKKNDRKQLLSKKNDGDKLKLNKKNDVDTFFSNENDGDEILNKKTDSHQLLSKKSDDNDNDDIAFFRSLLPSIEQFTQDQKLILRIELMKTILDFKQSLERKRECEYTSTLSGVPYETGELLTKQEYIPEDDDERGLDS